MFAPMMDIKTLLETADGYRELSGGLPETTVSYRVFRDTKLLGRLRSGAEITVGRFNNAMCWFAENWPTAEALPSVLVPFAAKSQAPAIPPEQDVA